jgi:leader peptidase (prepilin peptidase) / N-methyltransferase
LLAASAIDLELWVIPLSVCWFATAVAILGSVIAGWIIMPANIITYDLFPVASAKTGVLAVGAVIGLAISILFLFLGLIKRSYDTQNDSEVGDQQEENFNHRAEMLKEILFLLPIILCSSLALYIYKNCQPFAEGWVDLSQLPAISGLCGGIYGYFIGGAIVWATRILGTFAFGKEAMGLGDVHLMAAAGAVIGPDLVVVAFFIAPFSGLIWACFQMFLKKTRQIPYGPFLSLGVFAVMIFHNEIRNYLSFVFFH